jgi:hypothetical protein
VLVTFQVSRVTWCLIRRRSFTESDDEHLVKYIAKYNPERSGRNGNKLYQKLVENVSG